MQLTRRTLVLAVVLLALGAGWSALRSTSREIAVLRTFDVQGRDLYTTLWVVDDAEFVWIRAARPDRRWISHVVENPKVQLRRQGRSQPYRAVMYDDDRARAYVAPHFRAKYGLADRWREWTQGNDTIPIRLERR